MSGRLRRLRDRALAHLAMREDGAALALVRVGVGLSLLVLLVPFIATEAGHEVVTFAFCDDDHGGYRNLVGTPALRALGGARPDVIFSLLQAATVAAVLMTLGIFGRVPVIAAAICTHLVFAQNGDVSGGGDALLGNALFLLALGNCTQTLSLDCLIRRRQLVDADPIAAWPRKLLLVQLAVVYTVTGLQKLVSSAWTPFDGFSALYQILQSPQWARDPELILRANGWLVVPAMILSVVTILWEVFFFVVLLRPRTRWLFAVTGVFMHAGILLLMEVGIFSWLSMSFYPAMFSAGCARLAGRLGPGSSLQGNDHLEGAVGVAQPLAEEDGPPQLVGE